MSRRAIISVFTFASFILIALVVIFLAQGCRFDRQANRLCGATGILVLETEPTGATVQVNGQSRGVTNSTLSNLSPGSYDVTLTKDGYFPWKQHVELQQGKVINLVALLIPINPSLAPITSTPADRPLLSPDGQRLVYSVPSGTTAGIWMLDLSPQPFGLARKPILLLPDAPALKYSSGQYTWSPTSKELLISMDNAGLNASFEMSIDSPNTVTDVSQTVADLKQKWSDDLAKTNQTLGSDLPANAQQLLKNNANSVVWSPDNLKFLYQVTEGNSIVTYVYNKEAKSLVKAITEDKNKYSAVRWYADGQHLMVLEKDSLDSKSGTVSLMGMDGTNKQPVYNGTLIGDVLYTFLSGSKLVILTSFNLQSSDYYLYSINLR